MKLVHEVLKTKDGSIWSITPADSVYNAIASMAEHEVGALLVVDSPGAHSRSVDQLVGIISERDYARKVILKDKLSKEIAVQEIMTHDVIHVDSHSRIEDCVRLMREHHVRHLPVIDDGEISGMLSLRDLFAAIIEDQATTIENLEHYIRGEV